MDDIEYTVESESQDERIIARRLRIKDRLERQEAIKNKLAGIIERPITPIRPTKTIEVDNATEVISSQISALDEFIIEGESLLSDVKIASNNVEATRRKEQGKQQRELVERLENEARNEEEKFKEIANKWDMKVGKYKNHSDYDNLLTEQNDNCKLVINQKIKMIKLLQEIGKTAEEAYVKDLKRENDDIELISKRMEAHVKDMQIKFTNALTKIQETLFEDRSKTLNNHLKKSEGSWKARTLREMEMICLNLEEKDNYTQELDEIRNRGFEEFSIMRNKLERDVMTHEQQLQQMKAIYQLNQEKLQYNHEILRNREEENSIIKAQQKRRITKLQDNLNILRQKQVKQEKTQKSKVASLSEDYARVTAQISDLENKIRHFDHVDHKKFQDIWRLNYNVCRNLAAECLKADEMIKRYQLGLDWKKNEEKTWFLSQSDFENFNSDARHEKLLEIEPKLAPWQEKNLPKKVNIVPGAEPDKPSTADSARSSTVGTRSVVKREGTRFERRDLGLRPMVSP